MCGWGFALVVCCQHVFGKGSDRGQEDEVFGPTCEAQAKHFPRALHVGFFVKRIRLYMVDLSAE